MSRRSLKRTLFTSLAIVLLTTAAGLISPGPALAVITDSWSQFQYGPSHSGFNPGETILNRGNVPGLAEQWSQALGQPVYGTPIPAGDRVIVAAWDGSLTALDRGDGHVLWSADLGVPMPVTTPAIFGGTAIVAGGQWDLGGTVAAYDIQTGQQRWTTHLAESVEVSFPVLFRGNAYLGAAGTLYSLSATTGEILWSRALTGDIDGITGPVAVSENGRYVIAADGIGDLFGVSRASGKVAWTTKLGHGIWRGGAALSGSTGYIANGDESAEGGGVSLYAFRISTGRVLWKQDCGDDVHVTPTVGNGVVYNGAINGTMHAIDARTGAVRWVAEVPGEVWSSAALGNGVLYAGTESALLALNAATGQELFRAVIGSGYANMSSPAVTGGRVYVGSGEGDVRVFGLPD